MAKLRRAAEKYRTRQPINGVMVTISVADLLSDSAEARAAQSALRKRLIELHEQLGIHFPVYVLVTKTDLLNGFMAYFGSFDKARSDQIWGFTFPTKLAAAGLQSERRFRTTIRPAATAHGRGAAGYAADGTRRAPAHRKLPVPQEFAALRPLLGQYTEQVFATSVLKPRFTARYLFLRTQEGLPFDG